MAKTRIELRFGWEYPAIEEQLNNQGLTLGVLAPQFENARKYVLFLDKAGLMSESDVTKTFNKITSKISEKVMHHE